MNRQFFALLFAFLVMATPLRSADMMVEKRTFELPEFTTLSGKTIKDVKIGWESYGALNADKSNVILVAHYFSGTSHAAGKYADSDATAGYWDAIIGPGKAVDTNRYYVISADCLTNLNWGDPKVVTTGPASIDPATGKPYGMNFPLVTIGDFVKMQKALVDSLGIKKLYAVMGPSMGGLQTYEWASSYPEVVERIVPVVAAAEPGPWLTEWLNVWATPILLDPRWKGGDYYGKEPPIEGLKQALKIVSLQASHYRWAEDTFGMAWAEEGRDPRGAFAAKFKIEAALEASSAARAAVADANHFLYLVKANQIFVPGSVAGAKSAAEGIRRIKARTLILYSPTDQVFAADWVKATAEMLRNNGADVQTEEIAGPLGHLNGVALMAPLGPKIAQFLAK
jgi:homoserine O-acetyltransferase/O-succinyltransferase